MSRQKPTKSLGTRVLLASGRRCCLCVYLEGNSNVRKGQLAHINRDATDTRFENLVWLCLDHHDEYDSRTSQSKGLTSGEVTAYRDQLYASRHSNAAQPATLAQVDSHEVLPPLPEQTFFEVARRAHTEDLRFLNEPWRYPLWQVANQPDYFAYKASNLSDGVCLIERIDLPDGRIAIACLAVAGNPGVSITNAVEEICFQVCERFEIPPARLVWLEHYDGEQEWFWVTFESCLPSSLFKNPTWAVMTPMLWRSLGLRPKALLLQRDGYYESKLDKDFAWPSDALV